MPSYSTIENVFGPNGFEILEELEIETAALLERLEIELADNENA
jgi:hypothetical protein